MRADALAGKDTEVWCAMRFELPLPLDVEVAMAVSKAGQIVAEPSFEGKPIIRMGKRERAVWKGGGGGEEAGGRSAGGSHRGVYSERW